MHIAGKGCGKRSSNSQHDAIAYQLRLADMYDLFSGMQLGGADELVGFRVLALA